MNIVLYLSMWHICMLQNCSVAVVGEGEDLSIYEDDDVNPYLEGLDQEERRGGTGRSGAQPPPSDDAPASADTAQPPSSSSGDQPQVFKNVWFTFIDSNI